MRPGDDFVRAIPVPRARRALASSVMLKADVAFPSAQADVWLSRSSAALQCNVQVLCDANSRLPVLSFPRMKSSVQITRGIESLFGTRDENIRVMENGLNVRMR